MQPEKVIKEFLSSITGQQALEAHRLEQLEKREELAQELADIKVRRATALAPVEEEAAAAGIACEKARQMLEQAENHRRQVDGNMHRTRSDYATKIHSIERQLIASAPLELHAFIEELQVEAARLRQSGLVWSSDGKSSNRQSLEARQLAIRRAIDEAEKMKAQAIPDLAERLERIRSIFPEVVMAPIQGQILRGT